MYIARSRSPEAPYISGKWYPTPPPPPISAVLVTIGYYKKKKKTFPGFLGKSSRDSGQKIPPFPRKWECACGPSCIRVGAGPFPGSFLPLPLPVKFRQEGTRIDLMKLWFTGFDFYEKIQNANTYELPRCPRTKVAPVAFTVGPCTQCDESLFTKFPYTCTYRLFIYRPIICSEKT